MGEVTMDRSQSTVVDAGLQEELARGNRARRSVAPIMAHFLDSDGPSLVNDAIVASVRGYLGHLGQQLMDKTNGADGSELSQSLSDRLAGDGLIMDYLYSVALEGLIGKSLEQREAIDPVLSPLLQELIASDNAAVAELAMSVLAAQSRFSQDLRRMELPLLELPHEVFVRAAEVAETTISEDNGPVQRQVLLGLKRDYDEGRTRIGLLARLASALKGGAIAGLDLNHAGLAMFASSCASLLSVQRNQAIFACHEAQGVRLAVMLKAAGLNEEASEKQIARLGNTASIPHAIGQMSQAHAQDLLAAYVRGRDLP